jgi:3'(2'), 5'-bisphosphate nucleotidase
MAAAGRPVTIESLGAEVAPAAAAVRNAVLFMQAAEHDVIRFQVTKPDASPVTAADFVVQAFLASRLAQHFPNDALVAEEDASALRAAPAIGFRTCVRDRIRQLVPDAEIEWRQLLQWLDRGGGACGRRFWVLDPIDGTKGLLRGGQYVIALGLVVGGKVEIGVIGCPRLSLTTRTVLPAAPADRSQHAVVEVREDTNEGGVALAVRGQGAWWTPLHGRYLWPLSVSAESDPARIRALHSHESSHSDLGLLKHVLQQLGSHTSPILMDGQAKHVLVAAGAAELLMRSPIDSQYREAIWDEAAGSLLVEEAGGRVTDAAGQPLDFTTGRRLLRNTGLIASNGHLHDAILASVRQHNVR